MVDLDAYFHRIAYDGPRAPTLAVLRRLHALHPAAIPFEALEVLLDRGVDISPAAVDAKLIGARRGGYCFEQNSLFKRVLLTLGFQVEGLLARVRWGVAADAPPTPRSHMALRVTLDGETWLADVGFGGAVMTAPIRLAVRQPQQTPNGTFRLTDHEGDLLVEVAAGSGWAPVYRLGLEAQCDIDYESPNWMTSTHPASLFRNSLIVAKATPQALFALLDTRLTTRSADGAIAHESLDAAGMERVLIEVFQLPVEPALRPTLERIAAAKNADGASASS